MAVKVLHTSDWHVGRRIRGRDRSGEHRAVLNELTGLAQENDVDLTVVAGDVFDSASPTPVSEQIVWSALLELAEVGPVTVVAGNHDNQKRLDAVAPVLARADITMVGSPLSPGDGGVVTLESLGVRLALLPFVSHRNIVRVADIMGADPDQHSIAYVDRLASVVDALTQEMTTDTVNILASHLTVYGALAGGGERQAHVFGYAVPASVFPGHLSYVGLGHLHRQQKMPHSGAVWYSGSPLQLDFGEVADTKGALLIEAEAGLPARVTSLPLTSGTPLATATGTLEQVLARSDELAGAHVKVVLSESARVGLADEVRAGIPGAVEVVLESPTPTRRRSEARRSLEPIDAFHAYLEEKGADDVRLETLFAELLAEVSG